MDEPCPGIVALSEADEQTVIRSETAPDRVITILCLCKQCEKQWTQSHENAHWQHCSSPTYVYITFHGVQRCDGGDPLPPNDVRIKLKNECIYGASDPCHWWTDSVPGYPNWTVDYKVYTAGPLPYHTNIALTENTAGTYFSLVTCSPPVPNYDPCLPVVSGGQLNNAFVVGCCPPGGVYPGYGGHAHVEW
jgi:hypothetical protein